MLQNRIIFLKTLYNRLFMVGADPAYWVPHRAQVKNNLYQDKIGQVA